MDIGPVFGNNYIYKEEVVFQNVRFFKFILNLFYYLFFIVTFYYTVFNI